jgi:hypothetical protein
VDALAQLFIEKGLITEEEFHSKLREVMIEYENKGKEKVVFLSFKVMMMANSMTNSWEYMYVKSIR